MDTKKKFGENVLWFLEAVSAENAEDLDSPEVEVFGCDENGEEGSCMVSVVELAAEAAKEIKSLTAERDALKAKQSDLEVVQKALEKSKSMIRIYPDGTGTLVSQDQNGRAVFGEFTDVVTVLKWAKQTIESKE